MDTQIIVGCVLGVLAIGGLFVWCIAWDIRRRRNPEWRLKQLRLALIQVEYERDKLQLMLCDTEYEDVVLALNDMNSHLLGVHLSLANVRKQLRDVHKILPPE